MRFGLITPAVRLLPGRHAPWQRDATADDLRKIAEAADELGYHHLTCSDHVGIPVEVAKVRGGRYYDPFSTLGYFAAVTRRIKLVTHVLVLPYHHPLEVAKRLGTLDQLANGRVIAGVGVGTLREEFKFLGIDFEGRGERYEDALRALRAALGQRTPEYRGTHYDFRAVVIDPAAMQQHMPIWLGGHTPRSLRRALAFGDGWDPFGLSYEQLQSLLERARMWPEWRGRDQALDLVLTPAESFDVSTTEGIARATVIVERYVQLGAGALNLRFKHATREGYIDSLTQFATKVSVHFADSTRGSL
jgi:probable F420-dependent oxidoreductase